MTRRCIIAGNWKMYKTIPEAVSCVQELVPLVEDVELEVWLAVPFTAIKEAVAAAQGSRIRIGAQNMNDCSEGAFTGEIAGRMLTDAGAHFVVLGHSERRHLFGESSELINEKVHRALEEGLEPILCIGETLEQRKHEQVEEVLTAMLGKSLYGLNFEQMAKMVIAYEPVWAIGTGHTATPEQAQQVHYFCRQVIADKWDTKASQAISMLYGGSVKPENASTLMQGADVDGLLVGGASLEAHQFSQVIHYQTLG